MDSYSRPSVRWLQLVGVVGYVALVGALLIAHLNPATEYEISIYAATPTGFWVGCGVAISSALIVSFVSTRFAETMVGVVLGGLTSLAVVALPVIRGYKLHGIHDSPTHVGFTRELLEGGMAPTDLFYPGIHSVAAFISGITGLSAWQSTFLVPVIAVVVFFVFFPLLLREIVGGETAVVVGAFSAFLLVPIHQLASTTHPHPSSQAILFAIIPLFLIVRYLRSSGVAAQYRLFTPIGVLTFIMILAANLFHPQQVQNVLALLLAITVVQAVKQRLGDGSVGTSHRNVYAITGASVTAYVVWVAQSPGFRATLGGAVESLGGFVSGSGAAGSAVSSQTNSLQAIGSGLLELYLKLFTVSTLFILVAGACILLAFAGRLREPKLKPDTARLVRLFGLGLGAMFSIFLVYYLGDVGQYYFRQASFMMMIVAVLGAVGITYGMQLSSKPRVQRALRGTLIVGFATMFVLSSVVVFNSPYMHRANQHVTEAKVDGYNLTFQVTDDSALLGGVRQQPQRYYEALLDSENNGKRDITVNSTSIHSLQEARERPWYLFVHQNTYEREIIAYEEYRYSRADLVSPRRQTNVSRILTNGDTEVYYVP